MKKGLIFEDTIVMENENQGQISLSRVSCNQPQDFYGSKIRHKEWIELSIGESRHRRHIYHDWYYKKDEFIKIRLTPMQFAEMITHLNYGDGTPCTIIQHNGHMKEKYKSQDELTKFSNEYREQIKEIGQDIKNAKNRMKELINKKGALNRKEKKELNDLMDKIDREFNSNTPYLRDCFDESIDKAVTEFKLSCESAVTRTLIETGIDVVKNKQITGESNV